MPGSMIGKRVSNIIRLGVLIAIRQIWGLLRNLYLLTYQPYLTLKEIWDTRDKSQFFLLLWTAVSPGLTYIILRIVWDKWQYGVVLPSIGGLFWGVLVVEIGVFIYLAYWSWRVIKDGDS